MSKFPFGINPNLPLDYGAHKYGLSAFLKAQAWAWAEEQWGPDWAVQTFGKAPAKRPASPRAARTTALPRTRPTPR